MNGKVIETLAEFEAIGRPSGGYLPLWLAAVLAGVSRQRMQVIWESKPWGYVFLGGKFVTEKEFAQWLGSELRQKYRCQPSTGAPAPKVAP